jgi:hypothetical protein
MASGSYRVRIDTENAALPRRSPPSRRSRPRPRRLRRGSFLAVAALASWWEGTLRWRSPASRASVLAGIGAIVVLALSAGHEGQQETSRRWLARMPASARAALRRPSLAAALVLAWAALAGAVLVRDVTDMCNNLCVRGRPETLSKLIGELTRHPAGRAAFSLLWIAVGVALALAGRVARSRDRSGTP